MEIVECGARVEHAPDQVSDRAVPVRDGGELERLGREEVEPPRGAAGHIGQGAQGARGRDRHPAADVALPCTGNRGIDGQDERVVARIVRSGQRDSLIAARSFHRYS